MVVIGWLLVGIFKLSDNLDYIADTSEKSAVERHAGENLILEKCTIF
jgi:hypothetical protein